MFVQLRIRIRRNLWLLMKWRGWRGIHLLLKRIKNEDRVAQCQPRQTLPISNSSSSSIISFFLLIFSRSFFFFSPLQKCWKLKTLPLKSSARRFNFRPIVRFRWSKAMIPFLLPIKKAEMEHYKRYTQFTRSRFCILSFFLFLNYATLAWRLPCWLVYMFFRFCCFPVFDWWFVIC